MKLAIGTVVTMLALVAASSLQAAEYPLTAWRGADILYRVQLLARAYTANAPKISACLNRVSGVPACVEPWRKPIQRQLLPLSGALGQTTARSGRCTLWLADAYQTAFEASLNYSIGAVQAEAGDESKLRSALGSTRWLINEVPRIVRLCRTR